MTSLVPYKSLNNIPVRFAPDAVYPVIRSPVTLCHGKNRFPPFLTSSAAIEVSAPDLIYSALLLLPARFYDLAFPYRLPHQEFPPNAA
jgi:hypothetical protein